MARRDMRVRRRRVWLLDVLEERALQSALSVPLAQPAAEFGAIHAAVAPKQLVLTGMVQGIAKAYVPPSAKSPLNTQISAKGTVKGLTGEVLLGGFQTTLISGTTVAISNGVATFAFPAAGNTYLTVNYTGSAKINAKTAVQTGTIAGKIVGGGGVFAGATGSFSGSVTVNELTGAFTLNYTFAITPRA